MKKRFKKMKMKINITRQELAEGACGTITTEITEEHNALPDKAQYIAELINKILINMEEI